jgi:predicted RNA-binding Zn-ribbon protein involved in translation (DUF1610 family)
LVVAGFGIDGNTVLATCPACRAVMTARADAAAVPADTEQCPKCGAPRRDEAACPTCGLAADRMVAFTEAREAAVPDPVRAAWTRVTEPAAWSDGALHDELLHQVAAHNSYAWAAARYRTRRDTVAQRQLERLRRAAEATLLAGASARRDVAAKPYRATRSVLALLIVAIVVGVLYAMVIRGRPTAATSAAPVPAHPLTPGHPVGPSTIK